jgi:predicted phage terminase large subunit-like protein
MRKRQSVQQFLERYPAPGDLAQDLLPSTRQTPALRAIDAALVDLAQAPEDRGRLMVFMAPQEGKSSRASNWFPLWMLAQDPTLKLAIVSYSATKAERWGRWLRRMIEAYGERWGLALRTDSRAVDRFETTAGGQVVCVGIGGGLTGEQVDLAVLDDPVRGRAEAESLTYRERDWDWWESVGSTRLSSRGKVVLMMCMTGDTPVLLPDGSERPLRDVRPGDVVATYERGQLATSVVMNWANQGPDDLFRIKMKSGRVVRANARHPFLAIDANGREQWLKTGQIRPGVRILTATGASGAELLAPPTGAIDRLDARECATRTTARHGGLRAIDPPQPIRSTGAKPDSSIGTASVRKKSTSSSLSRTGSAPSAASPRPTPTPGPTGAGSFASTTTTRPDGFGDCSATTATWPSDTASPQRPSAPPLTTWNVTPDEVVAVEPCGREDVFDVQIARTENFIANGLVSHNTRWHADDLAGRLLVKEAGRWDVLRIPAVRDPEAPLVRDPEGASVYNRDGELISAQKRRPGYYRELQQTRSPYVWRSIYMQTPVVAEGNLFRRADARFWTPAASDTTHHDALGGRRIVIDGVARFVADMQRFITMDLAASKKTSADWTVASCWAITLEGVLVLLDRRRARLGEEDHWELAQPLTLIWACPQIYVERGFIGTTFVRDATMAGMRIEPLNADTDKITRALPATQRLKSHTVLFPAAVDWLDEWLDELAEFPTGAHDDQVDTFSYAARIVSAHWTPPSKTPERDLDEVERELRQAVEQRAYAAATGTTAAVDLGTAEW